MTVHQVIIIGSGPAGLTAAIYSARANLSPLMIEGYEAGGQLMITTDVENYPGFPEGVTGPDLMALWRKQAERFGTKFITKNVTKVDLEANPKKVYINDEEFLAETVIISTGASAKWLGIEAEKKMMGKGVSACATCDGAFFKGEKLAIVGGGDTAMEEALFLTRFATKVSVIHRRDQLRASKIMQDKAKNNPKIEFIWNSEVVDIIGENQVEAVKLYNNQTKKEETIPFGGVFIAIGHKPNTDLFVDQLEMKNGYLITQPDSTKTQIEGVFACGDVQDSYYRQAVTAAGSGCMAAIDAERYLESKEFG